MVELLVVMLVMLAVAAIAYPQALNMINSIKLRSSAGDLAGMMAQTRILAAKSNTTYPVLFGTINGSQAAYIDKNLSGAYSNNDPIIAFPQSIVPAAGAPSGSAGQPSAYTLSSDGAGTAYDNTHTIAFNSRGLPCDYITSATPATCITPAGGYFVFYLETSDGNHWAAAVVTRSGSAKVVTWDGSTWH